MHGEWFMFMHGEPGKNPLKKVTWPLLKRVLGYARPHVARSVALLAIILASTALGLVSPLIFRNLIDYAIPRADVLRLNLLAGALLAIPAAMGVLQVLENRTSTLIGSSVIFDLRVALFSHLERMSLRFFTHNRTGELISRMNNDVIGAQTAVSSTMVDIVTNLLTVAATLSVMVALEWRLTILGLIVLPLFALVARQLGKRLREVARRQMEENARMNTLLQETLNISGALLVKLFGKHRTEVERFGERADAVRRLGVQQAVAGGRFFAMMGAVSAIGTALVYLAGGHLAIRGVFTIGTIVAFSGYLAQLYGPLRSLASAPVSFAQSLVSFERVFEALDLPHDIAERPGATALQEVRGELAFEGVSFDYQAGGAAFRLSHVERLNRREMQAGVFSGASDRAEGGAGNGESGRGVGRPALQDIAFTVAPGTITALVGPSGAGKTTISYLVPRLYDPTSGRVTIDGADIREVTLESLQAAVGMVMQETYLFHDTIRANLLYARPEAADAELRAACEAANIHAFIAGLSEGYDTLVGERGYALSGGEKQRLAIARVILKNPRILVLDEATSHLDSESEALIQEALARVMRERTSIVIAHRLSTVLAADQILVLDRGRIVERGTHGALAAAGGLYSRLYDAQFSRQASDGSSLPRGGPATAGPAG